MPHASHLLRLPALVAFAQPRVEPAARFVDALAAQRGKARDARAAKACRDLVLGRARGAPAPLVGLREQHSEPELERLEPTEQLLVEIREPATNVDRQYQANERLTAREVRLDHGAPALLRIRRHAREPVSRQ